MNTGQDQSIQVKINWDLEYRSRATGTLNTGQDQSIQVKTNWDFEYRSKSTVILNTGQDQSIWHQTDQANGSYHNDNFNRNLFKTNCAKVNIPGVSKYFLM